MPAHSSAPEKRFSASLSESAIATPAPSGAAEPRYASIARTAGYADVAETTVRRWIAAGRLPAYRSGPKLLRVDLNDLDAMLSRIPTTAGGGE